MIFRCAESSNMEYSKILSISSASDTFTIFLFFLFILFFSFYLLDLFQINLNYNFILSTALSRKINIRRHTRRSCFPLFFFFWINICGHTRRSCLAFFSVHGSIFVGTRGYPDCLYLLFLDWSLFDDALVGLFPVGKLDWHVCPSSMLRVGWSFLLFSCNGHLFLYCQHTKSQVMKSLSHLYREIAPVSFPCWTSVLLIWRYSWTMGLINLVILDVVSMHWEELGEKLKYVYYKRCRVELLLK